MGTIDSSRSTSRMLRGMLAIGLAVCGCTAAEPSGSPSDAPPSAYPVVIVSLPAATASPTALPSASPSASPGGGLATPALQPGPTGETLFYDAPDDTMPELIGAASDGTVYLGLWSGASSMVAEDRRASVLALRPDGTVKPGWPSGGIQLDGLPIGWVVNPAGTVFAATVGPGEVTNQHEYPVTVVAVGSDGKVLPGWPFHTPKTWQPLPLRLVPGPDDSVCFEQARQDVVTQTSPTWPTALYCLGKNGRALPGWPVSSPTLTFGASVDPNGTVYVVDAVSVDQPLYRIVALGRDGKPLRGWTASERTGYLGGTWILLGPPPVVPLSEGRVALLVSPDEGGPAVQMLDSSAAKIRESREPPPATTDPMYTPDRLYYSDALLAPDSTLYVVYLSQYGAVSYVDAYDAQGVRLAGWPVEVPSRAFLAPAAGGKVWVLSDSSNGGASGPSVTLIDHAGKVAAGYPITTELSTGTKLGYQYFAPAVAGPDGSLYVAVSMGTTGAIVRLAP